MSKSSQVFRLLQEYHLGFGFPLTLQKMMVVMVITLGELRALQTFFCVQGQRGLTCTLGLLHCFWDRVSAVTPLKSAKQLMGCPSYRWLALFASEMRKMPK